MRPIVEYSPLTWMSSAQSHLSLLDKVQGRVDRLIHGAGGQGQQKRERQQQRLNPHTHQDNSTQLLDSAAQVQGAANTSSYGSSDPLKEE